MAFIVYIRKKFSQGTIEVGAELQDIHLLHETDAFFLCDNDDEWFNGHKTSCGFFGACLYVWHLGIMSMTAQKYAYSE